MTAAALIDEMLAQIFAEKAAWLARVTAADPDPRHWVWEQTQGPTTCETLRHIPTGQGYTFSVSVGDNFDNGAPSHDRR